jgi:hypothetical protein
VVKASGADTEEVTPDAPPTRPSVVLRGGRTLLRNRKLHVIARCRARCTVKVKGTLIIGGHPNPMRPEPSGTIASEASSTTMTTELGIGAALARVGRRALDAGASVKVVVQVRTQSEAGKSLTSEQLVIHR